MSKPIQAAKNTAARLAAVARRRGGGYAGSLLGGAAWPRAAYRFGWGPQAPALFQAAFAAAGELAGRRVTADDLRRLGLLAEGAARVPGDVPPAQVKALMDRAHGYGITGVSRSFRYIVRDSDGTLAFRDLAAARKHRLDSLHFLAARDADRRAFTREFGGSAVLEASDPKALRQGTSRIAAASRDHGSIEFGCGVPTGEVPSTDTRAGEWELFHRNVVAPLVAGKRVLDLGSNSGSLPLLLLRAGAREVVAVEFTADVAGPTARVRSWRDVRPQHIKVLAGDMGLFITEDLGAFDVVTALCSLSYLPEDDMGRIVSRAASMNAVLILQANDAIDNVHARTLDLQRLMRGNGYPEVQVHTPAGFRRPVLVGYTYQQVTAAAGARDLARHVASPGR